MELHLRTPHDLTLLLGIVSDQKDSVTFIIALYAFLSVNISGPIISDFMQYNNDRELSEFSEKIIEDMQT